MPIDTERRSEIMTELRSKAKNPMDYVAPLAGKMRLEPLIETWQEPSFEPRTAWDVFAFYDPRVNQTNLEPFVVETTWDERQEWRRVAELVEDPISLAPNFSVVRVPLNRERFTTLINESKQISFLFNLVENYSGCDGSFYGLKFDAGFHSISVHWWEDGPKDWYKLTEWAFELRAFLINSIREANPPSKLE